MIWLKYILIAVIAYLLGSISVGMIASKLMGGPNLREVGSGNTGATNALRALGNAGTDYTAYRMPYDLLERVTERILRELPKIDRVVYDMTTTPPRPVEWE